MIITVESRSTVLMYERNTCRILKCVILPTIRVECTINITTIIRQNRVLLQDENIPNKTSKASMAAPAACWPAGRVVKNAGLWIL